MDSVLLILIDAFMHAFFILINSFYHKTANPFKIKNTMPGTNEVRIIGTAILISFFTPEREV